MATLSNLLLRQKSRDPEPVTSLANNLPQELIEMIALQLPMSKVLDAQRISKAWKACIKSSPKLQRALFMKHVQPEDEWWTERQTRPISVISPEGRPLLIGYKHVWARIPENPSGEPFKPFLNPLLQHFFYKSSERYYFWEFTRIGNLLEGRLQKTNVNALLKAGSSWKTMWLLQPPCRGMYYKYRRYWSFKWAEGKIVNASGVTMFDLIEEYARVEAEPRGSFAEDHRRVWAKQAVSVIFQIHGFRSDELNVSSKKTPAEKSLVL